MLLSKSPETLTNSDKTEYMLARNYNTANMLRL